MELINEIESFRSYAKIRIGRFKGIDKKNLDLHLKECGSGSIVELKISTKSSEKISNVFA